MSDNSTSPKVLTEDSRGRASLRRYAFAPLLVSATTEATAQEICAAGPQEAVLVSALTASNSDGSNVHFWLSVSNSGNPSKALILDRIRVFSGEALFMADAIMINPGQTLFIHSDTADKLRVSGWLTAYL